MYSLHQIWGIYTSIRLSSNVQSIALEFWEFRVKPLENNFQVVICRGIIIILAIINLGITIRVPYTCWLFYIEDRCFIIPGILISVKLTLVIPDIRAMLLEKPEERGAAWASIEPDDQWIAHRIAPAYSQNIVY